MKFLAVLLFLGALATMWWGFWWGLCHLNDWVAFPSCVAVVALTITGLLVWNES